MFDLKQTLQKRKENRWPQSNYTSGTAGCPCVCFTPVFVGIVSTTRAFCHLPAGLIRLLQSYVVSERSPTPQEAADMDTLRAPTVLFSLSLQLLKMAKTIFLWFYCFFFFLCVACSFFHTSKETRGWGQRSTSQSQGFNDIPLVYCNSCDLDQVRQT